MSAERTIAEKYVIGSMLLDEEARAAGLSSLNEADFTIEKYGALFKALRDTDNFDHVILSSARVELAAEIGDIVKDVASTHNVRQHIEYVKDQSRRRRISISIREFESTLRDAEIPTPTIVAKFASHVAKLAAECVKGNTGKSDLENALVWIKDREVNRGKLSGLNCGFPALNRMTGGLQNQDLVVIAAPPSVGKTAFACNVAGHALGLGHSVLFVSAEMSARSLMLRFISGGARVPFSKIRDGYCTNEEMERIDEFASKMKSWKLSIMENTPISTADVEARVLGDKPELVIVDYLGLIKPAMGRNNREQEVAQMTADFKGIAKRHDLPLLLLSQLNRSSLTRKDKRPVLSDLRDSGAIEADADIVAFLYREDYAGVSGGQGKDGPAELLVRKHRNGETGMVELFWRGDIMQYETPADVDDSDVPAEWWDK